MTIEKFALGLLLIAILTGCSFQVGVDWHGQTNKDHRDYSKEDRTPEVTSTKWFWQ